MMKILITGAHGMLGQELARVFRDHEPVLWDREELDITDEGAVKERIGAARPACVINAAAYNDVDGAEKNTLLAERINGEAIGYLAEAAAAVGATFVHYSTDYVFGGNEEAGYKEDDMAHPLSAYGASKFLGEQKLLAYTASPIPYYLIRTSRLFGKQGNGKKSFVDVMLDLAQKKNVLEVVDEEYASPTFVADVAKRTREIVEQRKKSGVYHVTNSGACTWYVFAQEIFTTAKELGLIERVPLLTPVPANHFSRPARRPNYSQLLNTKLPPLRSWQEALREYLDRRERTW